jgi:hypothetical protein
MRRTFPPFSPVGPPFNGTIRLWLGDSGAFPGYQKGKGSFGEIKKSHSGSPPPGPSSDLIPESKLGCHPSPAERYKGLESPTHHKANPRWLGWLVNHTKSRIVSVPRSAQRSGFILAKERLRENIHGFV